MLILSSTADLIRVVTDAAGDIEVHASYLDLLAGVVTPTRANTASITTATTTTVVGSPAASTQRMVRHLNIRNNHASQAVLVTVFHTDGTTQEDLFECTLLASEALVFGATGRWVHYKADGGVYPRDTASIAATQAQMEAATDLNRPVTPGRFKDHPGVAKFFCTAPGDGFGNLEMFNLASITDTGNGRCTFVIATDFSSVNWAAGAFVSRSSTALSVTNLKFCTIRNASQTAGALEVECYDGTGTTAVQEDPLRYYAFGYGDH